MPHYFDIRPGDNADAVGVTAIPRGGGPVVLVYHRTGSGDMNEGIRGPADGPFYLAFARCHFVGGSGLAHVTLSVRSGIGTTYDAQLFEVQSRGVGRDMNVQYQAEEKRWPSPWLFGPRDEVVFAWTNPDSGTMVWGLQVGIAVGDMGASSVLRTDPVLREL